ncbi:hypothetical protein SAMN05720468_1307 [Fibrobacter sp. UWEL]|nr:hypothetical protein SAMN05720468_1307 [Fibrobacter sp. UWEL]
MGVVFFTRIFLTTKHFLYGALRAHIVRLKHVKSINAFATSFAFFYIAA